MAGVTAPRPGRSVRGRVILDCHLATVRTIKGVVKDPKGERDLDVSYTPYGLTCGVLAELRRMPADAFEEDALRRTLVALGLAWNLKTVVAPVEGDPTAVLTLSNGREMIVKADAGGKPMMVDVPATFEGMKAVGVPLLYAVHAAINADASSGNPTTPAPATPRAKRTPRKKA